MTVINRESGTSIDEVADGLYRITTPIPPSVFPGGFSFNQYLVLDDEPLLFHAGPRRTFDLVRQAIAAVVPVERLHWIGFSHVESDECGALNQLPAAAPHALPVCGRVAAMVSMEDLADRTPRALGNGEILVMGRRTYAWLDAPHLPHGWECGFLMERTSGTFLCHAPFTQPGDRTPALTEADILSPSEAMRHQMDYFAHGRDYAALFDHLIAERPTTLACMHGSAWRGDGAALLAALRDSLAGN